MDDLAFLFPGQGAQSVGMGAETVEAVPAARELFERAEGVLGYDLLVLCLGGPADKLDATNHSQPALYVASLAALERVKQDNPAAIQACRVTAGLSLGEYTALAFAGALTFEAGLRLVAERGAAMQEAAEASPGGMISVLGLDVEQLEALCDQARDDETLQVANLLCPGNTVLSGSNDACLRAKELAEKAGAIKVLPLAVAGAFHTRLMQPAVDRLSAALASTDFNKPRVPVVSNVDAQPHDDPEAIRALLLQQIVSPVRWEASIRWMLDEKQIGAFYEIGPGRVLRGLLKRIDRKAACEGVA